MYLVTSLSTADFDGSFALKSLSDAAVCALNKNAGPSLAVLGFDCLIFS